MQAQAAFPRLHSDHLIENVAVPENARIVALPVSESGTKWWKCDGHTFNDGTFEWSGTRKKH